MTDNNYMEEDDRSNNDNDNDDGLMAITAAPSLYSRPCFFRQTRQKGKIIKSVSEMYLRDDIGFGCYFFDPLASNRRKGAENAVGKPREIPSVAALLDLMPSRGDTSSTTTTAQQQQLLVIDTNVLLHNFDVLREALSLSSGSSNDAATADTTTDTTTTKMCMVLPQTALQECRGQNILVHDQAVELLRTSISSSSTSGATTSTTSQRHIFFADQHHVETQVTDSSQQDSMNDVNDARLRKVALYYGRHLASNNNNDDDDDDDSHDNSKVRVIFLTDDKNSRELAIQEQQAILGITTNTNTGANSKSKKRKSTTKQPTSPYSPFYYEALSVREWVQELEAKNDGWSLMDFCANLRSGTNNANTNAKSNNAKQFFPAHLPQQQVSGGVQAGQFHRGVYRSVETFGDSQSQTNTEGIVTIRKGDERVAITIPGWQNRNRAMDGDVVAVALHSVDQWLPLEGSSTTAASTKASTKAGISQETAEPTLSEMQNVPDAMTMGGGDGDDDVTMAKSLRPTGKVVGILRRNPDLYSGSIWERHNTTTIANATKGGGDDDDEAAAANAQQEDLSKWEQEHADGSTTCVFIPVDSKIPPLLIRTSQRDRWLGQRLVVAMDSWPSDSPFPLGHYTKTLGKIGDKAVETQVLLLQHKIPYEAFPAAVLACLPPADYDLLADYEATKEKDKRVDLRHLPILSIDPPGCTDIDDALHCFKMENGNYQVGVHIADVTHYVKAGTAMDLEAANRSTSTYLVDRRLDMLPSLLSTDLCSLKGNVDRFAFSVLWEVTPDAQIVDVKFQKSLIHSIAALTYQEAQTMIDLPDTPENMKDKQVAAVKGLAVLSRLFRSRRIGAGALTLASPEVKFVFDKETQNPTDVQAYAMLEANDLVMEFMLLANVTIGKKILRHYPTLSVLRRHPAPNRGRFDGLISKAKSRGFDLVIDDSKMLADSLDAADIEDDPYFNKLLRICATRCLSPAQYFCSGEYRPTEWHHYGLAAPVYTHFTSPIRRYADVCVHRLLAAATGVAPLPAHLSSKSYLHDLCANMNRRSRGAQNAGRSSVQLHTLIFFAGDGSGTGAREEDAYVLDVETSPDLEPSVRIIVPRYGIEGQVKLPIKADDPRLVRKPDQHMMVVEDKDGSSKSIRVFQKVKVRIWVKVSPDHQRELVLDLLEPAFGPVPAAAKDNSVKKSKAVPVATKGKSTPAKKRRKR